MRLFVFPAIVATCAAFAGCGQGSAPDPSPRGSDAPAAGSAAPGSTGPVNVVWILLDACRADHLSTYGYARPTSPNIDAYAKRGVVFEHHYAQAPNTLLSVPSFITGRYNPVFYQDARHLGIWFLRQPPAEEQLVSTIFRDNGYYTGMFSASPWYSKDSRFGKSFDDFALLVYGPDAPNGSLRDKNPYLFRWLDDHATKPFFLYLHMLDTHEPRYHNNTKTTWLDPAFPRKRDGELRRWKNDTFSEADQQHLVDLYDGGVAYADSTVAEIVDALLQHKVLERTILVISADHGEILGQDGQTVGHPSENSSDDLLHTPLIIMGPGIPSGRRIGIETENVDIVPTLVEVLGLKSTATFDGKSLVAAMNSAAPVPMHDFVFARTQSFLLDATLNRIVSVGDTKFDISGYDQGDIDFLKLPKRPTVIAYARPDWTGHRQAITPEPALVDRIARLDADRLKPAWEAYVALPKITPPYFETQTGGSLDPSAVVPSYDPKDNLWTRQRSRYLFRIAESDLLIADPATENPPALILGVDIPNGEYKVQAFACSPSEDGPPRGISFKFSKYPEEGSTYREFRLPAPEPGEIAEGWFDLGTYSVTKGNFVYSLAAGEKEDLTVLGALRFTQVGANVETPDEEKLRQEREQLEAVGYGNAK